MTNFKLTLTLSALVIATFSFGSLALAQNQPVANQAATPSQAPVNGPTIGQLTVAECQNQRRGQVLTKKEKEDNYKTITTVDGVSKNWLLSVFSYNTLHYRVFCDPLIFGVVDADSQIATTSVYKVAQNLVNLGVLLVLLVIAFANILRLKIDTYAVKKSIPLLVFGVIMANLSLPIIRTLIDFAGVLTATFIDNSSATGTIQDFVRSLVGAVYVGGYKTLAQAFGEINGGVGWTSMLGLVGLAGFAGLAFGPVVIAVVFGALFLILMPAIFFFLLGLLFVARIYFLIILTAVSPVAFASLGFEPLRTRIWGWWWIHFLKWTFMAPMTFFLFWLGVRFFDAAGGVMDIGTYVMVMFLLWYATRIPLAWGTTVMNKWNDWFVKPIGAGIQRGLGFRQAFETAQGIPGRAGVTASRIGSKYGFNLAKSFREFARVREEGAAKQEGISPSTGLGQFYGNLSNTLGLRNVLNPRETLQNAQRNRYATPQGRERPMTIARQILDNTVEDWQNRNFGDLKPNEQERLLERLAAETQSGDKDRVVAARYANGLIGRGGQFSDLDLGGVDTKPVHDTYNRLLERKTGYVGIDQELAKQLTPNTAAFERAVDRMSQKNLAKIDQLIRGNAAGKDVQLKAMADILRQLVTTSQGTLKSLQEIENDPETRAAALTLLQAKNPEFQKLVSELGELGLEKNRNALGSPSLEQFIGTSSMDELVAALQKAGAEPRAADLLMRPYQLEEDFIQLTPEANKAVMEASARFKTGNLRDGLRQRFIAELGNAGKDTAAQEPLIIQHFGTPKEPKDIPLPYEGNDPDLIGRLRPYSNLARSLQFLANANQTAEETRTVIENPPVEPPPTTQAGTEEQAAAAGTPNPADASPASTAGGTTP